MNLIALSKQYLRLHEALPFGLRNADGRLLPAAGQRGDRPARLEELLRDPLSDAAAVARLAQLQQRVRAVRQRHVDDLLYHGIYSAGQSTERYGSRHALSCALVAGETARVLGWSEPTTTALERAALTINVAMRRLQDPLAASETEITPDMRHQIDAHAAEGARLLAAPV